MLPIFKDPNTNMMLMQNKWASQLNALLANPLNNVSILKNVPLVIGTNVINHLLGKTQQGWFFTDVQDVDYIETMITVYRSEPFNALTLTLISSSNVVVNIGVF